MKSLNNFFIFVSATLVLSVGCGDESLISEQTGDGEHETAVGSFSIAYLDGLKSDLDTRTQSLISETARFNLGDLNASRDFYFLVSNGGGATVEDITISSDNPSFVVSPTTIDRLEPNAEIGVLPIVQVAISHGIANNGVGFVDLLPPGLNTAQVTMEGTSSGEDVILTVDYTITANVMAIDLLDDGTAVPLTVHDSSAASTTCGSLGFVRRYEVELPVIVNTGNVPIEVSLCNGSVPFDETLAPTDQLAIPVPATVRLQSNTVTDPDLLQVGNDGAAYLLLASPFPGEP